MRARRKSDRGGFALVMVIFLLFAVALAGTTGYQLASAEHELATGGEASEAALSVARAGIERYVGERIGVPGTTTFVIDSGSVTITPKKVVRVDSVTDMYVLEAVGTVADPRYPSSPARRTVRQYAKLHLMPVYPLGAFMTVASTLALDGDSYLSGLNSSYQGCASGWNGNGGNPIAAAVGRAVAGPPTVQFNVTGNGGIMYSGLGDGKKRLSSAQAVIDSVRVNWAVLKNSQFPVGALDGTSLPANNVFNALPADSFPIVRVNGNLGMATAYGRQGRGLLIVTGTLSQSGFLSSFEWDGIVLAGGLGSLGGAYNSFRVRGMVVTGLNGGTSTPINQAINPNVQIDNCTYNIKMANRSLAYFELIDGTRWEF